MLNGHLKQAHMLASYYYVHLIHKSLKVKVLIIKWGGFDFC